MPDEQSPKDPPYTLDDALAFCLALNDRLNDVSSRVETIRVFLEQAGVCSPEAFVERAKEMRADFQASYTERLPAAVDSVRRASLLRWLASHEGTKQ